MTSPPPFVKEIGSNEVSVRLDCHLLGVLGIIQTYGRRIRYCVTNSTSVFSGQRFVYPIMRLVKQSSAGSADSGVLAVGLGI